MGAPTKSMYFWYRVLKYKFRVVAVGWLSHTYRQRAKSLCCWQSLGPKGPHNGDQVLFVRQYAIEHCYFLVKDPGAGFEIFAWEALYHKETVIAK